MPVFKYRNFIPIDDTGLKTYEIIYKETCLLVRSEQNISNKILQWLISCRKPIENYITKHPEFLYSLKPVEIKSNMPEIVKYMCEISAKVAVGPMATVAGVIAEHIGKKFLSVYKTGRIIIENGGDIFMHFDREFIFGIYAGEHSPFTGKVKFKVKIVNQPVGICTSSGKIGHSLSFGSADAVTIVSNSSAFSDALATACGNLVKTEKDLYKAIEFAKQFPETIFVCCIKDNTISFWSRDGSCEIVTE